ncbi:uncharacterized protein CCR75_006198 [Bremia lactucae]|uniref:CUB-like domain-containing protein n=1 Tax=Bremia lactucae TaxID=4779 RepID=A0A976IBP7_BRELC|nr:hypothetical protein CCR75_006198 [Bremia lactucae]
MKFFFCSAIALAATASAEDTSKPLCIPSETEKGPYYFGNFNPGPPGYSCLSVTSNDSSAISWKVDFSFPGVIVDDRYWYDSYLSLNTHTVTMARLNSIPVVFNYISFVNQDLSAIAHITMHVQPDNIYNLGSMVRLKLCQSGPDPSWLGQYQKEVQVGNVPYSLFQGNIGTMALFTFVPKKCTTSFEGDMKGFLSPLELQSSYRLLTVRAGFMIRTGVDAVLSVDKQYMTYIAAVDPSP